MKTYKILTAAMAAAVLGGTSAMAQFNYNNGDVIAAFGNGAGTDVIVDLTQVVGSNASLLGIQNESGFSQDLSGVLDTAFGSVTSSLYWSVMAVNDTTLSGAAAGVTQGSANTVWATLARVDPSIQNDTPTVSGDDNSQHLSVLGIQQIANLTNPNQAPAGEIANAGAGIERVNISLSGFTSLVNNPVGNLNGDLGGTWSSSILNLGAGTSDFYQNDPGSPYTQNAGYLGNFSLSSGGVLSFSPVPEPSTWAMIGSGALTLLALRRRK